jgi:GT2 family glycosyltransferase
VSIAIVVLTHSRVHLLRQCVDNVLARTSMLTREIVLVDNASTDGTGDYLDGLTDKRIRVIHNGSNLGQNAYRSAFDSTTSDYLVELDDDVIDAPESWDRTLLEAYRGVPSCGYLAANLVNNPHDVTAQIMYGPSAGTYRYEDRDGVRLKLGAVGGWCAMTSREIYDRAGGFAQNSKYVFWLEDAAFISAVKKLGYEAAILDDLQVLHAGGDYYSERSPEKKRYWDEYFRRAQRQRRVKQFLVRVPFVRALNERFHLFVAPRERR